ncbi:hypothetical protein [Nocardia sp. NPDC056100]|uniref:hypothetical protein n=1 Tax=Nocardia sp. NPDC056100 TaxID=3345712 RepID=UPI0035DE3C6D
MTNPVPAWKPGSFSAATPSGTSGTPSRTFNINNLGPDMPHRITRMRTGREMVNKAIAENQTAKRA